MYLITGATGNIGNRVAKELLSKGKKVRVVSRHQDKLKELVNLGAEALAGDVNDKDFVNKAFAGISAAFCMIPPNTMAKDFRSDQQRVAHNYADAVKTNGVKHVVLLSSVGAHLRNGAGVVDGLADMEGYFAELKQINVLNLRPGYFMENQYFLIPMIKYLGIIGSAIRQDLKFPIVATKDIADKVTIQLLSLDFKGNSVEYVLGPKDLDFNEITHILSNAINKPDLKYVQFSNEEDKKGMVQTGYISENVAELFNELSESFNKGQALKAHTRTPENSTPTSFEEFAKSIAFAYNQS